MKRNGTTLVEVLIAIFVMGIGLLAIMALFPLGAMRMAQAIQDDRCLALARSAEGLANFEGVRVETTGAISNVVVGPSGAAAGNATIITTPDPHGLVSGQVVRVVGVLGMGNINPPTAARAITVLTPNSFQFNGGPLATGTYAGGGAWQTQSNAFGAVPVVTGLFYPADPFLTPPGLTPLVNGQLPTTPPPPIITAPVHPDGPSYPVLIDPIGFRSNIGVGLGDRWLASTIGTIPRRTLSFVSSNPMAIRSFTMLDELVFDPDAVPRVVTAVPTTRFERDNRYSFAYLAQRPRASDWKTVKLSVVVFNKRPTGMAAGVGLNETAFYPTPIPPGPNAAAPGTGSMAYFDVNRNVITLILTGTPPNLRAGDWILDSTPVFSTVEGFLYRTAHGNFYRVVNVTPIADPVVGNVLEVEVQQPLRDFVGSDVPQVVGPLPPNQPQIASTISGIYAGAAILLEGVAEVFEKGTGAVR